jgi:hypothetical protein
LTLERRKGLRQGRKLVLASDGTEVTAILVIRDVDQAMVKGIAWAFRGGRLRRLVEKLIEPS